MSDARKLKRILTAQKVIESQAQQKVSILSAQKVELERRIAAARDTVNASDMAVLFSDLYLGHQLKLVDKQTELETDLQEALGLLQIEKLKSKRIGERLARAEYVESRYREEQLLYEHLDHSLVGDG